MRELARLPRVSCAGPVDSSITGARSACIRVRQPSQTAAASGTRLPLKRVNSSAWLRPPQTAVRPFLGSAPHLPNGIRAAARDLRAARDPSAWMQEGSAPQHDTDQPPSDEAIRTALYEVLGTVRFDSATRRSVRPAVIQHMGYTQEGLDAVAVDVKPAIKAEFKRIRLVRCPRIARSPHPMSVPATMHGDYDLFHAVA